MSCPEEDFQAVEIICFDLISQKYKDEEKTFSAILLALVEDVRYASIIPSVNLLICIY